MIFAGMKSKFNLLYIKTLNLLQFLVTRFFIFLIQLEKQRCTPKTLLLIRLDLIGDYVIVRNFFYSLKNSKKYSHYRITLAGNIIWKELAEHFDKGAIDEFIWIDRVSFYRNLIYKIKILKQIYQRGYEVVIDSTYTREILYGDALVKASNAAQRIGSSGALDVYAKWKRNFLSDGYYTELIPATENALFEFYRNLEFFQQLLEEKISIQNLHIHVSDVELNELLFSSYVVIVPGASDNKRRWSPANFALIIEEFSGIEPLNFVICGSNAENQIANEILSSLKTNKVINLCGKLKLSQLVKVISKAMLLISNETGTIHIAASTKTPFVCISNGNHFGRFHPYPAEVFDKAIFVYPPKIKAHLTDPDYLQEKYRFGSELDINTVPVQDVREAVNKQIFNLFHLQQ